MTVLGYFDLDGISMGGWIGIEVRRCGDCRAWARPGPNGIREGGEPVPHTSVPVPRMDSPRHPSTHAGLLLRHILHVHLGHAPVPQARAALSAVRGRSSLLQRASMPEPCTSRLARCRRSCTRTSCMNGELSCLVAPLGTPPPPRTHTATGRGLYWAVAVRCSIALPAVHVTRVVLVRAARVRSWFLATWGVHGLMCSTEQTNGIPGEG